MRNLILAIFILTTPALVPACQHFAFSKSDATAFDMNSAARSINALDQAAQDAKSAYEAMLASTQPAKQSFDRYSSSVDRFDGATAEVKKAIDSVEKTANDFLASYAKQREEIKNTDLRAAMLMRKESIERQISDLKVELSAALTAADSLRRELIDLRTYFAASLNPQSIQGAAVVGEKINQAVDALGKSTARVNLELTDLATSLSSKSAQ
jgi:chromosome segregation ATPase